jgi:selenium metabolism protein YedF
MPKIIDARGLPCPQPVLKTKEAVERFKGESIVIMVNSRESSNNVERFLSNSGVTIERIEEKDGEFHIHTREIGAGIQTASVSETIVCPTIPVGAGTAIFINKDRIGHGSDELGINLMKAFVAMIKDITVQPKSICFMNSGVKLTIIGAETLPYLQELEKKGIEMLVCGTCLSYFNLKEQIGVGRISNMYDISETMLQSSKVVTI